MYHEKMNMVSNLSEGSQEPIIYYFAYFSREVEKLGTHYEALRTLCTAHSLLCTVQCIVCCTLHSAHSALHSAKYYDCTIYSTTT